MSRTLIKDTPQNIDKEVMIKGRVLGRRDHGKIVFLNVTDRTGEIQIVVELDKVSLPDSVRSQTIIEITGTISKRPDKLVNPDMITGGIEMQSTEVKVLADSEITPFDISETENTSLPILFDNRPFTLRDEKIKNIFKVQEDLINGFRKTLKAEDFTEFQSPAIVGNAPEGGSEVFKLDYYGKDAYLAQSPQVYKQMLVGVYERVFTIAKAYRAEPSATTRHLSEYISLDVEWGYINSWKEIMETCEKTVKGMIDNTDVEFDTSVEIPRIKLREAQEILGSDKSEPDLNPEEERKICEWAKEKYGSEFIFITHFPTKKRPFYTYPDPEDPEYTLSFDLLFRGLEIVTGGQRIHDYKQLVENIKKWGNKEEDFDFYLQAFKYGMPPEGGFAIGTERVTKQLLGLKNVAEASLFPRNMERIDKRLSI